jgi:hypothetical protein
MRPFILFPIATLLLTSCAISSPRSKPEPVVSAVPGWFHSREYRQYTDDFGFVGVGSGPTREAALDAATADISRQLQVSVEAKLEGVTQSITSNDQESIRSNFTSATKTVSNASLKGVETVQTAEAKGTFYAFCYLDKGGFATTLKTEIERLRDAVAGAKSASDGYLIKGKVFQAIETLIGACRTASEHDATVSLLQVVEGRNSPGLEYLTGDLSNEIRDCLDGVSLRVESGSDQQDVKRGELLPQPLVGRILSRHGAGGSPAAVEGVTVKLTSAEGNLLEKQVTASDGRISFHPIAVGEGLQTYTAQIEPPVSDARVSKAAKSLSARFTIRVAPGVKLSFSVSAEDEAGKRLQVMEEALAKAVTSAGHVLNRESPIRLVANAQVGEAKTLDGMNGPQHIVKISVLVQLIDSATTTTLASMSVSGQGVGKSSTAALEEAYRSVNFSADDLAGMIAKR